jgi:hypothetical protein
MNEDELSRLKEFRQLKKQIPNPPSKVLCSSDYGLQRGDVTSLSTVIPGCGHGFDQNDRADINPQPRMGIALSR